MGRDYLSIFVLTRSRDGAVVARWAHNPKVVGSSPAPATRKEVICQFKESGEETEATTE